MEKHTKDQKELKRKEKNKQIKKKRRVVKILFVFFIIILCIAIFLVYKTYKNGWGLKGFVSTVVGHDATKLEELDKIQFLLLGDNQGLTDSIMVCSYDPKTQEAAILSIPRDTFIGRYKSRAKATDKINSLYQGGDTEAIMEAVNELTGLDLKYYIVVETDALIELVDTIGGVYFDVPIDMKYDDSAQDLHINLKAGYQLIDGEKAEQLLRFRHNNDGTSYSYEYGDNDYGRMRTQREFITQAISQTLQVSNVFKITELLDIVKNNVKTNLDFNSIKDYIPYVIEFSTENIQTGALPGVSELCNGVWVFIHDEEESEALIQEMFFGVKQEELTNEIETNELNTITKNTNATNAKNTTNTTKNNRT